VTAHRRGAMLVLLAVSLSFLLTLTVCWLDLWRLRSLHVEAQRTADAVALAGASGLITGSEDSVRIRAARFAAGNTVGGHPAQVDSLAIDTQAGTVVAWVGATTGPLFLAPSGLRVVASAGATVSASVAGVRGTPVPQGNAFGWYKHGGAGRDSAVIRLTR
jgi:Flp pilus assembly protein TadG